MFRPAGARTALRSSRIIHSSLAPARTAGRRFASTDPPHAKSRSWKNSALRWGIAIAGIYYYNTSPIFADSPKSNLLNPNVDAMESDGKHPTLDQLTASSRNKGQKDPSALQIAIEETSEDLANQELQKPNAGTHSQPTPANPSRTEAATAGAADLEEEADSEGAFNPVTGEINWDCPCLGGMAYGPCGEEFRSAFSCFVYSNEDPKGMDCVDKFQRMQDCFRAHPEVYKGELEDDEELDAELAKEKEQLQKEIAERRADVEAKQETGAVNGKNSSNDTSATKTENISETPRRSSKRSTEDTTRSESQPQPAPKTASHTPSGYSSEKGASYGAASETLPQRRTPMPSSDGVPESEELVPKAAHDARGVSEQDIRSKAT